MTKRPPRPRPPSPHYGTDAALAGMAGGGVGSLIAEVVREIMPEGPWKHVLTVATPWIAVGISGTGLFIKVVYLDPWVANQKHAAAAAAVDKLLREYAAYADRILNDPSSSDKLKAEVREQLEFLVKRRGDLIVARMEEIIAPARPKRPKRR